MQPPPLSAPPFDATQNPDRVDVWRVLLSDAGHYLEQLWKVLSLDEADRARRFHFERDRERFVIARGLLRVLLSRYLSTEPGQLAFRYGRFGKPELVTNPNLKFNVSHSNQRVLYAVGTGRELGVDVEHVRPVRNLVGIVERNWTRAEQAAFRQSADGLRDRTFFTLWTLKEAYVKALGEGLSRPLNSFSVAPREGDEVTLRDAPGDAGRWSLRRLDAGADDYVAAVAVEGNGWHLDIAEMKSPTA